MSPVCLLLLHSGERSMLGLAGRGSSPSDHGLQRICLKLLQDTIKCCKSLDNTCARTRDKYWRGGPNTFHQKIYPLGGADISYPWVNDEMAGCSFDSILFVYSQTDNLKTLNSCAFQVTSCQLTHNY